MVVLGAVVRYLRVINQNTEPMQTEPNTNLQRRARKRVKELKAFYSHLVLYLLVNTGFVVINLVFTPGRWWFLSALLGWGIGLLVHAFNTFRPVNLFSKEWEERKTREFMEREGNR